MVLTTLVRRSAACVSLAVAQALHTRCDRGVRFGVVADVQYCDIDDARNFAGTEVRFYRGSLDGARRAAQGFEEARLGRGLDFVAQLGDLIDGQNAGGYGALKGEKPRSKKALDEVLEALGACEVIKAGVPYEEDYGEPAEKPEVYEEAYGEPAAGPDVVAEARRLLEREAEDLVEEIARLTTFFDEEERAVVERHRRTPTKVNEDKPSLQDLRRVSQKLEKRWLQQEHARDVKGLLKRVPGGAIVDSPISFGKSKLVGELLESPATVRKTASPEGGRLVAAPPRRTKPKNRLREKMTQAREEKFLQEW